MRVAVLLVNHNQWELTRQCIESVTRSRDVEIIPVLVDNGSSGPVPDWVGEFPGLLFDRLDGNRGFTGGNNRAFELSEGSGAPYVFFLNNDTEIDPGTIHLLVTQAGEDEDAGIVTAPVYYAGEPDLIWSAGGRLDSFRMRYIQNDYRTRSDLPAGPYRTEFCSGCAMLMRRSVFEEAGGFETDLFIYFEDALLSSAVIRNGRSIVVHPGGSIYHHVSVSLGGVLSPRAVYFSHRNRAIAARRILDPREFRFFLLYYTWNTLLKTLAYPLRGSGNLVTWMWKAWSDGLRCRAGGIPPGLDPENGGTEATV